MISALIVTVKRKATGGLADISPGHLKQGIYLVQQEEKKWWMADPQTHYISSDLVTYQAMAQARGFWLWKIWAGPKPPPSRNTWPGLALA